MRQRSLRPASFALPAIRSSAGGFSLVELLISVLVGVALVRRSPRLVQATEEGQAFRSRLGRALELIDELERDGEEIALVIADQIMPGMKGVELLEEVLGHHPARPALTGKLDLPMPRLGITRGRAGGAAGASSHAFVSRKSAW